MESGRLNRSKRKGQVVHTPTVNHFMDTHKITSNLSATLHSVRATIKPTLRIYCQLERNKNQMIAVDNLDKTKETMHLRRRLLQ